MENNKALQTITHTGKAIDVRKNMLNVEPVMQALTRPEKIIFFASTKKPIADIEQVELIERLGNMVQMIAKDAGIKEIDDYDVTRFTDVLNKYYRDMSLMEIKLAFEMMMAGELDAYLPKDRHGDPDRSHYQTFNVAYTTKVLNAYKRKSAEVEAKAYSMMPAEESVITEYQKERYASNIKRMTIKAFLQYKYTNSINLDMLNGLLIYNELEKAGIAEPVQITDADKQQAVRRLLKKGQDGLINNFVVQCIRKMQTKHSAVDAEALIIARNRAILKSFDALIKNEIQITNYIRYAGYKL